MLKSLFDEFGCTNVVSMSKWRHIGQCSSRNQFTYQVPATRRTFLCRDSDLHPIVCQPSCNELVVGQQFCIIVRSCWLLIGSSSTQPPTRPELIVILIYKKDVKPIAIQYWYLSGCFVCNFPLPHRFVEDGHCCQPQPPPVSFSAHGCFCNFWSVSCWWNHLQIVGASEHELSLRDYQWAARSQGGGLLLQCVGWGCSQLLTKLQFLYSKVWFFFSPPSRSAQ